MQVVQVPSLMTLPFIFGSAKSHTGRRPLEMVRACETSCKESQQTKHAWLACCTSDIMESLVARIVGKPTLVSCTFESGVCSGHGQPTTKLNNIHTLNICQVFVLDGWWKRSGKQKSLDNVISLK